MGKLNSVRKGDRAEYITQGIFSALGYSIQILRQEDFGIDFLCTISEKDTLVSYPTKSFTVQLKTNQDNIVYPINESKKIKWLLENDLPFFICYFDDKKNRVDFFSTALLFRYIITSPLEVTKVSFQQSAGLGKSIVHLGKHKKGNKIFNVELGRAFLSISLNNLSNEKLIEKRKIILNKVVRKESQNILYRNLRLPFMQWLHEYRTNNKTIKFGWAHFSDDGLISSSKLLENVGHIVMSLCNTYKSEGHEDDYKKLKEFVLRLPFNREYKSSLIAMGFRNKNGGEIK